MYVKVLHSVRNNLCNMHKVDLVQKNWPLHTTPKELKNTTITNHSGFVCEENPARKSRDYRDVIVLEKPVFSNSSGLKRVVE